jgi:hypothetical protein
MVGAVVPNRCSSLLNDAPSASIKLASHGRHIQLAGIGTGQSGLRYQIWNAALPLPPQYFSDTVVHSCFLLEQYLEHLMDDT